jgi:PAS domain S-box-containing protein
MDLGGAQAGISLVVVVHSMIAAACLTLAVVHLAVWSRNRDALANLAFAIVAASAAANAIGDMVILKAQTPEIYAAAQRWKNIPILLLLVGLAGFSYHYLKAGRRWLAVAAIGLRLVALVINFSVGESLNFLQITILRSVPFMGENVAVAVGVKNPWQGIGQLALFMLMLYFLDASLTAWRRGHRAAAIFVGGSLTLYMFASVARAYWVYWQGADWPNSATLFSLGVVVVIGYALSADLLRAKKLVIELDERENEADLAADAASLGIWTRDIVRDRISASKKWRELFGFTPDEPIRLEQVLERVHADDRSAFGDRLAVAARQGGDYHSEFRLVLPDGNLRWIAAVGRVECDATGRPLRSRGACIDVTARKRAEQEMLALRQDIAHVGRVSVMGQLSSALAHEIKQPLGAILRNAEAAALFLQHPTPDLHEISAIVEDIRKDDQRASEVIDRMRTLLRREEVAMTSLDIGEVLGDVGMLLHPDAAARHVALRLELPAGLPPVHGDRVQIQQVLLNLMLNGMDALEGAGHPDRSVTVTARCATAASVEISVLDTGPGIDASQLVRIFEPFFTTKSKGIGMGLSISRAIVESHGGRLWAENHSSGGAIFRFTLPIGRATATTGA